jgi:hypothetical protein
MRAAKYLNPSCAEDGCQWLQAESRKNVVRADVAVLLRADLLDALPQGPSLTRLRAFVNEGLQRTVLPQDTKND